MNLTNPVFLTPMLAGTIFCLAGVLLIKFPPKKINSLYGYRTPRSMKSEAAWNFAQKYSGREFVIWGGILLVGSFFGLICNPENEIGTFTGLGLVTIATIFIFVRTEIAIIRFLKTR